MNIQNENFFQVTEYPKFKATLVSIILYQDKQYWINSTFLIGEDYVCQLCLNGPYSSHAEAKIELKDHVPPWYESFIEQEIAKKEPDKRRQLDSRDKFEISFDERDAKERAELLAKQQKEKAKKDKKHQYYLVRKERLARGEDTNPNGHGPKDPEWLRNDDDEWKP